MNNPGKLDMLKKNSTGNTIGLIIILLLLASAWSYKGYALDDNTGASEHQVPGSYDRIVVRFGNLDTWSCIVLFLIAPLGVWCYRLKQNLALKAGDLEKKVSELERTQQALCRNETRFREFVEQTDNLILRTEDTGELLYMNTSAKKMFGLGEADEYADLNIFSFTHEDDREKTKTGLKQWQDSHENLLSFENRIVSQNGQIYFLTWNVHQHLDEHGQKAGINFIGHDLTCVREASEDTHYAQSQFRILVEQSMAGIYIIQEGSFLYVNPMLADMFGYPQEEIISSHTPVSLTVEEDRDMVAENIRKRLDGEEKQMRYSLKLRRGDGAVVDVEVHGIITEFNNKPAIIGVAIDITERKRTEDALRQSEERNKALLEAIPDLMLILTKEGVIIDFKLGSENYLTIKKGMSLRELDISTKLADSLLGSVQTAILTRKVEPFEFKLSREKDPLFFDTRIIAINDYEALVIIRDITERKKAEEQAKQQQQQLMHADKMATLGTLVSGVAHEVNNPNNFILLNGKIILKLWDDVKPILAQYYEKNGDFMLAGMLYSEANQKIGKLILGIINGSERIKNIVQSLKCFARRDRGDLEQVVNINNVVESSIFIVDSLIRKSTKHFSVEYGEDLPDVKGNYQQLEQLVINLLTNSCQSIDDIEKGMKVRTSVCKNCGKVIIDVSDEGISIPPENMQHIMDPFFTTKRDSGGTGLGLSISYDIIKDHGGDLKFVSAPGKGTTATVTLPRVCAKSEVAYNPDYS